MVMSSAAISQDLPDDGELLSVIANGLPPYWSVDNLEVVATSRGGDAARPEAIVRFEADASPQQDLFAQTGKEGPFYLVTRTEEADAIRRLYGFQELTYRAGNWSGAATIENAVTGFGQPRDLFSGPTLEVGTEEAAERLAALRDTALTGAISTQEAELTALRAAHGTAVAELKAENSRALSELRSAHARDLAELRSANDSALAEAETEGRQGIEELSRRYDAELAELSAERELLVTKTQTALVDARDAAAKELEELQAEHAARRSALVTEQREKVAELENALSEAETEGQQRVEAARRRYNSELANLTAEREPRIAEVRAELEELLAAEQEKANAALADAREASAAELEELRAEHAAKRGALIEAQRQEMAELETALAIERQSLQRQVETADETIALQQRLLASLTERAEGTDGVLAEFNAAREARRAFFARLPENWSGQVRCEAEDPAVYNYTGPMSVSLSDSASTMGRAGIIGTMNAVWDSRSSPPSISLVLLNDGLTFPVSMRARVAGRAMFPFESHDVIDLTITQDGRMEGAATRPLTVDRVSRDVTCTFLLGAVGQ